MKPIVAIGDIHGRTTWEGIVKAHPDAQFVFLGDYLDPYDSIPREKLLANLLQIMVFKRRNPENVVLLLGNHDMHYFSENALKGTRYDFQIERFAAPLFTEYRDLFQYAWQEGNWLFTHAGVSQEWFEDDFCGDISRPVADQLNYPSEAQIPALFRVGQVRGGRKGRTGGIFWADVSELADPLHGYVQVVGHNRVPDVSVQEGSHGNRIIFCDCLRYGNYLCLEHLG